MPFFFAHLGEPAEEHSPLGILLDNPAAILAGGTIFLLSSLVFYTLFPMKPAYRRAFFAIVAIISLLFAALALLSLTKPPAPPLSYHTHADFKVYMEGQQLNFSQPRFMSTSESALSLFVHLHDLDGDVIHHHKRNITMADFFETLNMSFNSTCFVTDAGTFCGEGQKKLRMFVRHDGGDWEENFAMGEYVFEDLDRILITYGSEDMDTLKKQMESVTDKACIQSGECPERGQPTDSSCAGDVCIVS
ncbi:MAG: hypothetical protein AB1324_06190 [Candidatus Micrarchaeota archaeon]